jgi:hypothetical protein
MSFRRSSILLGGFFVCLFAVFLAIGISRATDVEARAPHGHATTTRWSGSRSAFAPRYENQIMGTVAAIQDTGFVMRSQKNIFSNKASATSSVTTVHTDEETRIQAQGKNNTSVKVGDMVFVGGAFDHETSILQADRIMILPKNNVPGPSFMGKMPAKKPSKSHPVKK